jgi:hypothetical protein
MPMKPPNAAPVGVDMPYAIVPAALLVEGSAAARAAGKSVRFDEPGKAKNVTE